MAVDTLHNDYTNSLTAWTYCRDVIGGDDNVKAKKTLYVPMLSEQSTTEYQAMLNRPVFEGFTQRTLDGLSGLVFSKSPTQEVSTKLESLFKNIDLDNSTLTDIAQDTVSDVLSVGRLGLLVDMASVDTQGMTAAEVELLNVRSYIKKYTTENIINWKYENINNTQVLTMVVLKETKEVWSDEFTSDLVDVYRVLSLQEGIYTVRVFEEGENGFMSSEPIYPKMNGNAMNEIPFISITPTSLTLTPEKPPLYDLAKVNMTHFKTNVDYYHGMHFTALPTPYGSGVQMGENETLAIGSTSFHMFPDPDAKLAYLEFEGDGLQTLEREKSTLKETMVTLGSNMLQSDKKVAEAENTLAIRNAGQNATLISTADTVSRGITKALQIMNAWIGGTDEVSYRLNTDYNLTQMDAPTMTAMVNAWMSGAFSKKDLYTNLKKGELIEDNKTYEEYQADIEEDTPTLTVSPIKSPNKTEDKSTLQSIREKMGI